jgi:hypothetical protein
MPFEKEISELFSFSRGFHICLDEALSRSPAMRREFLSDFAFSSSDFLLLAPLNAKLIQLGCTLRLERAPEFSEGVSGR